MYKIVKCLNCKTFAMTSAAVAFRCLHCGKSFDVTRMKIYYSSDSPQIVTKVLQRMKEEEARSKFGDEKFDNFM